MHHSTGAASHDGGGAGASRGRTGTSINRLQLVVVMKTQKISLKQTMAVVILAVLAAGIMSSHQGTSDGSGNDLALSPAADNAGGDTGSVHR